MGDRIGSNVGFWITLFMLILCNMTTLILMIALNFGGYRP